MFKKNKREANKFPSPRDKDFMLKCMEYDHVNRIKIKKIDIKNVAENDMIIEAIKTQYETPNDRQSPNNFINVKLINPIFV